MWYIFQSLQYETVKCKYSKLVEEVVALKSKLTEKLLKFWQFFTFEFFLQNYKKVIVFKYKGYFTL